MPNSSTDRRFIMQAIKRTVPVRLSKSQQSFVNRCIGARRAVRNMFTATARLHRRYFGKWPSAYEMAREIRMLKREDPAFAWLAEMSKFIVEDARDAHSNAMSNWFNPEMPDHGPPVFQKRNARGTGSFMAAGSAAAVKMLSRRVLRLPYVGTVRLEAKLPKDAVVKSVRLMKRNGLYMACVSMQMEEMLGDEPEYLVGGLDVGIEPLGVDSLGNVYANPRSYKKTLSGRRRWQRTLSRRKEGSANWHKAQDRIDALDRRIKGLRDDAHHQLSRSVAGKFAILGVETLNVKGMDKLRHQSQAVRDAAIGGLLAKVRYKGDWYGSEVKAMSQWYPSSKLCSECGERNGELGREKYWTCPNCGVRHERNDNAAKNLAVGALGQVVPEVKPTVLRELVKSRMTLDRMRDAAAELAMVGFVDDLLALARGESSGETGEDDMGISLERLVAYVAAGGVHQSMRQAA